MIPNDTILRFPEVKARTGLSRTSIYMYIKAGLFPKSVTLGARSQGWYASQV